MNQTLQYYNDNAASFASGTLSVDFGAIQNLFLSYLKSEAHILDFGCGAGRDTKYFLDHGFLVTAIDGSQELCKLASNYTGIHVQHSYFQDLCSIDQYDAIWACSSILHAQKSELPSIFEKMTAALHVGGYLYTSFKSSNFEGMRNGRYFTNFEESSFRDFIQAFPQLKIIKLWTTSDVRPERSNEQWLNIILQKTI